MQTSKTFSIHFWLKMTKRKGDLAPIYARITVNGKRSEISLKRYGVSNVQLILISQNNSGLIQMKHLLRSWSIKVKLKNYDNYTQ